MVLTEKEYDERIASLKETAKKAGYNLEMFVGKDSTNRRSCLFHGGAIASLSKGDWFEINIDAIGDVCLEIDGEMFKDKANAGRVGRELVSFGYTTDQELETAIDKQNIYIDSNNWYEVSGCVNGEFIDLEYVSIDFDDYLETIQEVLDNITNIEGWIEAARQ